MDAVRHVKIYQPSLATRVHNKSPHAYLKKIVEVIRSGMGFPAVHFDDAHIKMMLAKGVSMEDARDYCLMGCVEPQKAGRLYQWTSTAYTQWPICIELVMNTVCLSGTASRFARTLVLWKITTPTRNSKLPLRK